MEASRRRPRPSPGAGRSAPAGADAFQGIHHPQGAVQSQAADGGDLAQDGRVPTTRGRQVRCTSGVADGAGGPPRADPHRPPRAAPRNGRGAGVPAGVLCCLAFTWVLGTTQTASLQIVWPSMPEAETERAD